MRGPESVQSQDHRETYGEVVEKMVNRMHVSAQKYGPLDKRLQFVDLLTTMLDRVRKYEKDGNTEWLMDAANYCIMEAMFPAHAQAHFRATDTHESPGYRDFAGRRHHGPTIALQEGESR